MRRIFVVQRILGKASFGLGVFFMRRIFDEVYFE